MVNYIRQNKICWINTGYGNMGSILLAYISLSVLMTWPIILHLNSMLFSDFGDARGGIWWTWAGIHGLNNDPLSQLISAPFGSNLQLIPRQQVIEFLQISLGKITGEIAAYNLLLILSFPLTAFTSYLLLTSLDLNKLSSFVGGFIFGFSPGVIMHAKGGHINSAFNVFIPLLLLGLFYNKSKRNVWSALLVGLSYALVTLTWLYFGYFAIFIILFFICYDFVTSSSDDKSRIIANYSVAALIAFLLIIPFQYKMIMRYFTPAYSGGPSGLARDFGGLMVFSARPLEYILPSIDHPLFGRFVMNFSRDHLHGSNLFEQTLYLGVIPLLLCIIGLFLWFNKKDNDGHRRYYMIFIIGTLLMMFLSMPPFVSFRNIQLPTVSYFMYKIAPMFRVYARFGILASFFTACAAAVVLSELSQRMSKVRYYLLLSALLPVLIFEYWSIPPHYARSIDPPPAVYQWLAREPGDIIIAEYPMMKSDEASFYTYLFWQRIHKKRMVNGASLDNKNAWNFYHRVNDLSDPETPRLLKDVGVKYIIVHNKMYWEGEIPESLKRYYPPDVSARQYGDGKSPSNVFLPKPFKVFGDDVIYVLDRISDAT